MKYIIGIDLGTSGTKTVLFDERGVAVSSATVEYPLHQPQNGWAEQDPADWWAAAVSTLKQVLEQSGVAKADVVSIGLSGQMHGLVMLDGNGDVLRNSIIWCDGRTIAQCGEITRRVGEKRLIEITANPALPGFTASKILWVRENEPELYDKCRHILLPKDYIRYKLTGAFATEVSDASGMNLMDIPKRCWSDEVLAALEIDRSMLADLYESTEITGAITSEAAAKTGLASGTPVVGGAGDNAAAAVGTGVVREGRAFTTIGTSGVIFAHSDKVTIDPNGRVHTFCAAVPGAWTVMSCTLAAGLSLQWLRNNLFAAEMEAAAGMGQDPYQLMNIQAERSPIGANRLIYLPYLMGERSPILDSNARGAFFGLSAMHTKYDMLRAVMEGVAYSQLDCLEVLTGMGVVSSEMRMCGGGAKSPFWQQMFADVYGCKVTAPVSAEGPALGAAILAGVGAGMFSDVPAACDAVVAMKDEIKSPNEESGAKYRQFYEIYRSLYPVMRDQFHTLAAL